MRVKWLNRTLVLGPYLCLCLSEAEYLAAERHVGWQRDDADPWCSPGGARVHYNLDGAKPVAIVCLDSPDAGSVEIAGILAHEAVHIWQGWCRTMDEDTPGDEISAYAVQNLVVLLMDEWWRRTHHE